MEWTPQQDNNKFTIDLNNKEDMDIMTEHSMLFYAQSDFALDLAILCTTVTLLVYAIARVQGRIRTRVHSGLHLFWTCLIMGDITVCLTSVAATAYAYFRNNGHPDNVTCIDVSPINRYYAYAWLLLWGLFVVAVLRSTVAITWLNRIRSAERLADMGRGVGILCLSLIYLFPLALVSRSNADSLTPESAPMTVCLPAFGRLSDIDSVLSAMSIAWLVAIVLATIISARVSQSRRISRLAVPLAVMTHFLPTMMLFAWVTNLTNNVTELRDTLPAIFALLTAFNAICNFFTYKLFPLATEDAEIAGDENTELSINDGSAKVEQYIANAKKDCKDLSYGSEAPPAYSEKIYIV